MLNLPEELLEEILCRVPATTLRRLRLTCKEWNRLFIDRRFSRKHFDKAAKQFMLLIRTEKFRLSLLSINLHSGFPSAEVTGELSLIDSDSNSIQVIINKIFHCDGLLLCTIKEDTRIVLWNPCTGQTKWIHTGENHYKNGHDFVLGYYQDNKSCDKSYKILSYKGCYIYDKQEFKIYDIKSNTWRNLDVTPIPHYYFVYTYHPVSLKGKTYWFAYDSKAEQVGLISFDYTTERFERIRLPYQCHIFYDFSLSVVGEEKLSVLLQLKDTPRREIWITNKIDDETKEMSWRKLLEVEVGTRYHMWSGFRFLVDEEKKTVVCCEKCKHERQPVITVSIVGEDSNATRVYIIVWTRPPHNWPYSVDYVPSLIQIQQSEANEKEANKLYLL